MRVSISGSRAVAHADQDRSLDLSITRRMLGVELDGSRRIWPAHAGCPVGPDGSRRIQKYRLDDHRDDQGPSDNYRIARRLASDATAVAVAPLRWRQDRSRWGVPRLVGFGPLMAVRGGSGTTTTVPVEVVTDRAPTHPVMLDELMAAAWHPHRPVCQQPDRSWPRPPQGDSASDARVQVRLHRAAGRADATVPPAEPGCAKPASTHATETLIP